MLTKTKTNANTSRIVAILLACILVLSMLPIGMIMQVFAKGVQSFDVTLGSYSKTAQVTLTNAADPTNTMTKTTANGTAIFENFIDDESTYNISITELIGYEDYSKNGITLTSGQSSYDVNDLVKIDKITINGFVKDEKGAAYANADISYSAYSGKLTGTTTTNDSGKYTFEAYKGQTYVVNASTTDNKYDTTVATVTVTNPTNDYTCADMSFSIKQLVIDTSAGADGTITDDATVNYGESKTVTATANEGYRIDSFTVDGTEEAKAKGEKNYSFDFSNIIAGHTVDVTFIRQTYVVSFDVSTGGEVTYNTSETANVGKITDVTVNENDTVDFTASANTAKGFHVETVSIGSNVILADGNNSTATQSGTVPAVTEPITVTVRFALNEYDVIISESQNGSAKPEKSEVSYGGSAKITITPADGYNIETVLVNSANASYTINDDETSYTLEIENIKKNTKVDISYSAVPVIPYDNISFNESDAITTDTTAESVVKYVYLKDGSVTFQTEKDGIRINKVKTTGASFKTQTWTITKSTLVNSVEVFYDKKWHSVELTKNIQIVIDTTAPVLADITDMGWSTAGSITIDGTATDNEPQDSSNPSSGLSRVVWSNTELNAEQVKNETVNKAEIANGEYSFTISGEQNSTYYIYAVDFAGNVSQAKTVQVRIDRKNPTITAFTYSTNENTVLDTLINFLTFGTISSNKIYVTVTGSDEIITSGLKEITLYYAGEVLETKEVSKNAATFELTEAKFKAGKEISATITDNAGNISGDGVATKATDTGVTSQAKSNTVKIDSTKPTAVISPADAVYKDNNEKLWYNGDLVLNVEATDNNVGIKSVEVKLNGMSLASDVNGKAINADFSSAYTTKENFVINTSQNAVDGENTLEVIVTNNAGVKSDVYQQKVYIDTTKPNVASFNVERVHTSIIEKVINFLSFGIFCNDEVEVTVAANDSSATSGIKEITLFVDSEEYATKTVNNENKCVFTIPTSEITGEELVFNKKLSAKSTDNVGNITEGAVEPTTDNSNVQNSGLMIETVKPTVDVAYAPAVSNKNTATATAGDWYASDVEFTVKATDEHSGIAKVEISINGTALTEDKDNKSIFENFSARPAKTKEETFVVNTDQATIASDGSYTLNVSVTDNAGNVSILYTKKIYKDTEKPVIVGFDFAATDYVEGIKTETTVEKTDYGFYFKEDTNVTITARDSVPTSGIKSITYYIVDINSGKSAEATVSVDANNQITFTVPANFKGQIYAKATDNVDNVAADFVNPNSAIVENAAKHEEETHIAFDKDKTTYIANDNTELYDKDVPVTITVTDTYSGIRSIEWFVIAPYDTDNNISKQKLTVPNIGNNKDDKISGWNIDNMEQNLVTQMSNTIIVKNNSNNITVKVRMTDRAGNYIVKDITDADGWQSITFSIDKTKPVIDVVYDNNTPDQDFSDFYKADRTATIKVTERNFKVEDIVYTITNTDDVIPTLSAWMEHKNATVPDGTYYTATVLYHADGDYTFDISYSDLAKNAADAFAQHKFTIDHTLPTISVSYDNINAKNGNYYSAERTATIIINEHNFETSRIVVTGTATDNGATTTFPATSAWSDNGDTHVATINYPANAKYSFDIAYSDKAGNGTVDYTVEEFFVDKTAPTLAISGVADKSANNGDIIPVITCSDTNYDANGVTVNMSGINNGVSKVNGSYSDIANGQTFTFVNFEKTKENDDIYTLTVKVVDFAGNETTQTITFSVNRFGSVYVFDDTLTSIGGKYVQDEVDVILTETNVDSLIHDTIKLKMTKNGTASDLVEGKDYSVAKSGGNGQWSQYKYTANKTLFSNDGRYTVTLYSEDAAGNINENIDETKKAEISFGVDKTAPVIVPADFESDKQYPVESKTVSVGIKDNLVLETVKIYLNDNEVEYKADGETYTFDIAESNSKQNVKFVATDAAGNEFELPVENFLVSTNVFVRWFNNTPLFVGSIIGVAVLGLGVTVLVVFGKKKKKTV